jgi:hypothetical protein
VAAMILGMAFGFTTVIVLAGACYVIALIARGQRRDQRDSEVLPPV